MPAAEYACAVGGAGEWDRFQSSAVLSGDTRLDAAAGRRECGRAAAGDPGLLDFFALSVPFCEPALGSARGRDRDAVSDGDERLLLRLRSAAACDRVRFLRAGHGVLANGGGTGGKATGGIRRFRRGPLRCTDDALLCARSAGAVCLRGNRAYGTDAAGARGILGRA